MPLLHGSPSFAGPTPRPRSRGARCARRRRDRRPAAHPRRRRPPRPGVTPVHLRPPRATGRDRAGRHRGHRPVLQLPRRHRSSHGCVAARRPGERESREPAAPPTDPCPRRTSVSRPWSRGRCRAARHRDRHDRPGAPTANGVPTGHHRRTQRRASPPRRRARRARRANRELVAELNRPQTRP